MAGKLEVSIVPKNALFVFDKKLLKKTLRQAGQEVAAVARRLIRTSTGGPGQPPKSRTGRLVRGIVVSPSRDGMRVSVRDDAQDAKGVPYSLSLEGGSQGGGPGNARTGAHQKGRYSRHGVRIVAPRPFISLALAQREASLSARIQSAVTDGIAFKRIKA